MLKKIIEASFALLFVAFSFYYTEKACEVVEQSDPIMQKIMEVKTDFEIEAINAEIDNNYLVPGYSGRTVDAKASFDKMQKYGAYNESLLVFEEVEPTLSKEEYYDKYIISGNGFTNKIALVFPIALDTTTTEEVKTILEENDARGTFFVDGGYLENNQDTILNLASSFHEVEILNYNGTYDTLLFENVLDKLQVLTNTKGKYCYALYDQKEVLDLCEKEKMHTIIPTLNVTNKLYTTLKGKVREGAIISINPTNDNIKELSVSIKYLKQRGFVLDTLDSLLDEANNIEK